MQFYIAGEVTTLTSPSLGGMVESGGEDNVSQVGQSSVIELLANNPLKVSGGSLKKSVNTFAEGPAKNAANCVRIFPASEPTVSTTTIDPTDTKSMPTITRFKKIFLQSMLED